MQSDATAPIRRVMSSSGRVWKTNAQGAADYLFNPVFMTFFLMCVILFATLMQPSEETALPVPAQMLLWGSMIMTSLIWLFASAWVLVAAYDRGYVKVILTPLMLLPLVFINVLVGEFILSIYNTEFRASYGTMLENFAQNIIILIVFDIMHARFVVPQHPRYVPSEATSSALARAAEPVTMPPEAFAPRATQVSSQPVSIETGIAQNKGNSSGRDDGQTTNTPAPEQPRYIEIAREKIDRASIDWIKSEDHYLSLQMTDQNVMLRGKLRAVVDELGDDLGTQINRSVWVAFSAIRGMEEQASGHLDVSLTDGTVFRVSSSRRLIFKHSYDRFKAA